MRLSLSLISLFACLVVSSCAKSELGTPQETVSSERDQEGISSNRVTMSDVEKTLQSSQTKTGVLEKSFIISPYTSATSDTLMYIVNYKDNGGWKIYSSDKRTPAILAEDNKGCFSIENGSPAVAIWIAHMAEDIARVRRASDDELSFSEDEIRANKAFWGIEQPRIHGDPYWHETPPGHWEETITSQDVVIDSLSEPHLVAKWHQRAPYNEYCPYLESDPYTRSVAGCVAIAGSQMLLYLHNTLGVPNTMVSSGYCIGNTNGYYRDFTNPTTTVWSTMSAEYQDTSSVSLPEAIMIGHVGALVGMHYCDPLIGDPYSWAIPVNLKTNVFEPYGINCSHGDYNENIVKNSLENRMPVVVSGSDLLVPTNGHIHAFVIDGFRYTQTVYTHRHYYVLDESPGGMMYVMPEDYYTYTYSSPVLSSIKINWGWKSQWKNGLNDGWYSLTAGWTVMESDGHGGYVYYDYNHWLKMIYGFSVMQ